MAITRGTQEILEGYVERVVFRNSESGFSVLRVKTDTNHDLQTAVGKMQDVSPGERLRFTGEWIVDKSHGRQFSIATCIPLSPDTVKGIMRFLGSGLIPGIGPVMAKRLVERFGLSTLDIIENQPQRLAEVDGIGIKRASVLQAAWIEKKAIKEVMIFLESAGISPSYAHRIFKRYGNDAIRLVTENPYRLAADIHGIGFLTADSIAEKMGVPRESEHRAEAGVLHTLGELAAGGHVFSPKEPLVEHATELLAVDLDLVEKAVDRLVLMGQLRREETGSQGAHIYLPRLHKAETSAAVSIRTLVEHRAQPLKLSPAQAVSDVERQSGMELGVEQKQAFQALKTARVLLLTGGPGTGKTTLLKGLVSCLLQQELDVVLASPTGRAAKRMAESVGREAKTIHRLLEYTPGNQRFAYNESHKLDADVVVIDEVSMVDIELFAALLSAIKPNARVILVGDPDQLPSVGPGAVLADLIAASKQTSGGLVNVHLQEIFRQARSSMIVTGAHDILHGHPPQSGAQGSDADFFLIERNDPEDCLTVIKELLKNRIPTRFGFDPLTDIQVLTPMHKGLLGTQNLNAELQTLLNPNGPMAADRFRVGDKVMQIRNNYDQEVFNGDIGRITSVDEDEGWVAVAYPERSVRYPQSDLDQLVLAYACSIHKSQGSEYSAVVIPLHTQHYVMLKRNLLYTAVTRGKKLVVVVGSKKALHLAVRNATMTERFSGLKERLI